MCLERNPDMHFYDLDTVKRKKRTFLVVFILALIPLTLLTGYQLFQMIMELAANINGGDLIPGILAFLLKIFVGVILLILISAIWLGICCYAPLRSLQAYYSNHVFPQAVLMNTDYSYVHYTEQLLDMTELIQENIIDPNTVYKQKKDEYLTGRYKTIDFELAPISLSYGDRQEISGSIAIFTGLKGLFHQEDFVQISCSSQYDAFAEDLSSKRGFEIKKRITTNDYRTGLITAPETQIISEEQLLLAEQLILEICNQILSSFYLIFSHGRIYFIDNSSSMIIKLPLWSKIEKEICEIEKNGIANINMVVDTFMTVTNMNTDNSLSNPTQR